jgi:hypothetical protein
MKQNQKEVAEIILPHGVTAEMIAAWKERYGAEKVKLASLPLDQNGDKFLDVIIRTPGRKELSEFEKWIDRNPDKAKEILVNSCLLTSKEEVKAVEELFLAAADGIIQLLPTPKAVVKNL